MIKAVLIFLLLMSTTVTANQQAQTFSSGVQQVPLIELYTSEGCSSCPPADRWLSGLTKDQGLWKSFVPVAFHVDYWDYIGWPDRFAKKQYSQRQRRYASEHGERTVYTPGVRKAGQEWRSWRAFGKPNLRNAKQVGDLSLAVKPNGDFQAKFNGQDFARGVVKQLNIALLGMGLSSEVTRGENRGKELKHDFVVLNLSSYSSITGAVWRGTIPKPREKASSYAVAAWVGDGKTQQPIQVTGGRLLSLH